jgi:Lectin C-type domain
MNRVLSIFVLVLVACGSAAAQVSPVQTLYNIHNQHTYLVSPHGLDWQTARAYAHSLGGYLVAINNNDEQFFIASNYAGLQQPLWLGLNDAANEGVFVWDSGEPVNYTVWCNTEPNNFGGDEDHVEIFAPHTGFAQCWNDIQSPYTGTGTPASRGIVELAYGVRVDFDVAPVTCGSTPFPTPLGALTGPEGVSWNGAGANANRFPLVTGIQEFGMPVRGTKYLRLSGEGQVNLPAGGPFPRPAPANVNEVRIAIPPGTKGVSFAYDFITAEDFPYNDGVDVAVVDANGNLVAHLVYHDVLGSNLGVVESTGNYCSDFGGVEILDMGPSTIARYLPILPYPAYLSIVAWNGNDNAVSSAFHLDAVQFWGTDKLQLSMSAPFGPGSIRVTNNQGIPNTPYWTAFTLTQGAYPNGWLFGLDITLSELLSQVAFGVPFAGTLDSAGHSVFTLGSGVPAGLPVYAVSLQFGPEITASAPDFFVTQ